jgi:hypothetical protein
VTEASEESGGADRRALRAELERLEVKVEDHPALVVIQQMEELDRVMLWYGQNAAEVLMTIDALNHDGLGTLMMIQDEVSFGEKHRDFATELGRTWHNFVASAHTVADHMREQFNEQPDDLRQEYEQKKRELLDPHEVVGFVAKSRNVLVHRGVFHTGVTWRFTQKTDTFEVNCRTDILLNRYASWWNAPARRYIESKAPRLDVGVAIREHAEAVLPLYEWYEERVYEYHYPTLSDLDESAARLREISEILEPGSMPPLDEPIRFQRPEERGSEKAGARGPARSSAARRRSKTNTKRGRRKRK